MTAFYFYKSFTFMVDMSHYTKQTKKIAPFPHPSDSLIYNDLRSSIIFHYSSVFHHVFCVPFNGAISSSFNAAVTCFGGSGGVVSNV